MRLGVPLMRLLIVVAAGLSATSGSAEDLRSVCDSDHNGTVAAAEAQGCAEQRFERARGDADGLVQGQFAAALPDADGLRQQFVEVDRDGNGRISRDEWMAWFGPAYAGDGEALTGTD
jgi:hypothetical protein